MRSFIPLGFFLGCFALSAQTTVLYQPSSPDHGPFPSDTLTVSDSNQLTGKRINLPFPAECSSGAPLSACSDTKLLNELDGFSVYPQLRVCFSGPINPSTIQDGLFVVSLQQFAPPIRVTRIMYDSASNCALAKPDQVLNSGTLYALAVTSAIRDTGGAAVRADPAFTSWITSSLGESIGKILTSLLPTTLAGGSVFTTLSATSWAGNVRNFVAKDSTSGTLYSPAGTPLTISRLSDLTSLTWRAQTAAAPDNFLSLEVPLNVLTGVDRVAVGSFLSPNFLAPATIPQVPTKQSTSALQPYPFWRLLNVSSPGKLANYAPISFHVFLPATKKPKGGYPVAIYGHGLSDNQWTGATTYVASTLAKAGIAVIGVEVMGHGFGPGSQVVLTPRGASPITAMSPGRTLPVSPDPTVTPLVFDPGQGGGCLVLPGPFATRDCFRQTAVDVFALVKLITAKKGLADQLGLDAGRISFIGQSFGAILGTIVGATEPNVKTVILNAGGGPVVDVGRLQPRPVPDQPVSPNNANLGDIYLLTRILPLLPAEPFLSDFAFRGQPPLLVPNIEVQKAFEVAEWYNMPGDSLAFAPLLKGKPVLFQIALGDMEVPNPTNSNLIRGASGQKSTWLYRFDRALQIAGPSSLPLQPHRFLADDHIFESSARTSVAIAAQSQVANFINSDGKSISNPNENIGAPFQQSDGIFEVPAALPDAVNYPPLPPAGN